jgi:hypothetical protein
MQPTDPGQYQLKPEDPKHMNIDRPHESRSRKDGESNDEADSQ